MKMSIICAVAVHTLLHCYIDLHTDMFYGFTRCIDVHSFPVSFISVCIMSVLQLSTKNMFHVVNLKLYTTMEDIIFNRYAIVYVYVFMFALGFHFDLFMCFVSF